MTKTRAKGEGSVFYLPDRDRWAAQISVTDHDTGRVRKVTKTAATKTEAGKLLGILKAESADAPDERLRVGAVMERWREAQAGSWSTATIEYHDFVGKHAAPITDTYADKLTSEKVEKLLAALAAKGLSRNTIAKVKSDITSALRWATATGLVVLWRGINPGEVAKLPKTEASKRKARSLTADEARALVEVAGTHRLGAAVVTGLYTGLRPDEIRALRWEDIDFESSTVTVSHRMSSENKLTAPKTEKSARRLTAPAPVMEALREHRARQDAEREVSEWPESDLVFRSEVGTPLNPSNLRRALRTLSARAGIDEVSMYDMRHSFASLLIDAGHAAHEVADALGHADLRMLEQHYRHRLAPTVVVPELRL